jgi:hypothetical protein
VKSLAELQSMTGDRLRLERDDVVDTIIAALGAETQPA